MIYKVVKSRAALAEPLLLCGNQIFPEIQSGKHSWRPFLPLPHACRVLAPSAEKQCVLCWPHQQPEASRSKSKTEQLGVGGEREVKSLQCLWHRGTLALASTPGLHQMLTAMCEKPEIAPHKLPASFQRHISLGLVLWCQALGRF